MLYIYVTRRHTPEMILNYNLSRKLATIVFLYHLLAICLKFVSHPLAYMSEFLIIRILSSSPLNLCMSYLIFIRFWYKLETTLRDNNFLTLGFVQSRSFPRAANNFWWVQVAPSEISDPFIKTEGISNYPAACSNLVMKNGRLHNQMDHSTSVGTLALTVEL